MATYVRTQTIEQPIGPSGTLSLKVTGAAVRVRAVDGGFARVRGRFTIRAMSDADADRIFSEVQLRVTAGDTWLSVDEPRNGGDSRRGADAHRFGSDVVDLDVEVDAPSGCELRLAGVSADVSVEGLHGMQHYTTVSGDLLLSGIGGTVDLTTVSGDATIRADGALSLDANSVSGDLSAVTPRYRSLAANSVSGDVEVEGAFDTTAAHRVETVSGDLTVALHGGATVEVRGLSSDVRAELPHRVEGHAGRRRLTIGDGAAQLSFSSMSGDLIVTPPRRLTPAGVEQPSAGARADTPPAAPAELEILRALERGEIDVEEAARRLAGGAR